MSGSDDRCGIGAWGGPAGFSRGLHGSAGVSKTWQDSEGVGRCRGALMAATSRKGANRGNQGSQAVVGLLKGSLRRRGASGEDGRCLEGLQVSAGDGRGR